MTTDTPPPPPKGWTIVPADDPRLDFLPVRPMRYCKEKGWEMSSRRAGYAIGSVAKSLYTYALPIHAEPQPRLPYACKHESRNIMGQCVACGDMGQTESAAKDEEIARLKKCLFQMQEAAKSLASADPKGRAGAAKPPLGLIPPEAMRQAAIVHGLGARKYGAWNWRQTKVQASTYIHAALRHIEEYQDRLDAEPESGQSPLAHAIASLNILLDAKKAGTLIDDRPPAPLELDKNCPD
jgi:hypothetical protein